MMREISENITRKQNVKTPKTMLPCWRGTLFTKAANFKKIPEDIQINHEIDAKNIPKTIEKTIKSNPKNDAGKYRKISPKRSPTLRFGIPFWSQLLETLTRWTVFLPICFSEPPKVISDAFWRLLASLGSIKSFLLERCWRPATIFSTPTFPKNLPELRNYGTDKKMLFKHFTTHMTQLKPSTNQNHT